MNDKLCIAPHCDRKMERLENGEAPVADSQQNTGLSNATDEIATSEDITDPLFMNRLLLSDLLKVYA